MENIIKKRYFYGKMLKLVYSVLTNSGELKESLKFGAMYKLPYLCLTNHK